MPEIRTLLNAERELMLHALGLTPRRTTFAGDGDRKRDGVTKRWADRNRFITDNGSEDYIVWEGLIASGYAHRARFIYSPESTAFRVSPLGMTALGEAVLRRIPVLLRKGETS